MTHKVARRPHRVTMGREGRSTSRDGENNATFRSTVGPQPASKTRLRKRGPRPFGRIPKRWTWHVRLGASPLPTLPTESRIPLLVRLSNYERPLSMNHLSTSRAHATKRTRYESTAHFPEWQIPHSVPGRTLPRHRPRVGLHVPPLRAWWGGVRGVGVDGLAFMPRHRCGGLMACVWWGWKVGGSWATA